MSLNHLFPKPLDKVDISLDLSSEQADLLQSRFHNLFDLRDMDIGEVATATGIPAEKLERLKALANESLRDGPTFIQERDKANFETALHDLAIPFDIMQQAGIASFIEARGHLAELEKIPGLQPDQVKKLAAHARLSVISLDMTLNQKLVAAGVNSVTELAAVKSVNDLAARVGIESSALGQVYRRAQVYHETLWAKLAEFKIAHALVNKGSGSSAVQPLPAQVAEVVASDDPADCNPNLSALSPAAYLVDLIKFLQDSFPQSFPDLDSFERRFFRSFKDLSICRDTVEVKVPQVEIANQVLESFIYRGWQELAKAYQKAHPPKPDRSALDKILSYGFSEADLQAALDHYGNPNVEITWERLTQKGITQDDLKRAFEAAYPKKADPGDLNKLLQQLSLSETELADVLGIGRQIEYRDQLYASFQIQDFGYPYPDVLAKMFDAYLGEIGTTRKEIATAFFALPDRAKLDALLKRLCLTEQKLKTTLGLTEAELGKLDQQIPTVRQVEALPELIRKVKTKGQYPVAPPDPDHLAAYQEALTQAESAINRVKEYTLADIRANLIYIALKLQKALNLSPQIATAKALGNYLYTDLSADAIIKTTLIANLIEALQSFVQAFRIGSATEITLHISRDDFEARWRWLQSHSVWHAAQMIFLYPENIRLPNIRVPITPQFRDFLDTITGNPSPQNIQVAVEQYTKSFSLVNCLDSACLFQNKLIVLGNGRAIGYFTETGEWTGWSPPDSLKDPYYMQNIGTVAWNNMICAASLFHDPSDQNDKICLFFIKHTEKGFELDKDSTIITITDPKALIPTGFARIILGVDTVFIYSIPPVKPGDIENTLSVYLFNLDGSVELNREFTVDNLPLIEAIGPLNDKHYLLFGSEIRVVLLEIDFSMATWKIKRYELLGVPSTSIIGATVGQDKIYIFRSPCKNLLYGMTTNTLTIFTPGTGFGSDINFNIDFSFQNPGYYRDFKWFNNELLLLGTNGIIAITEKNGTWSASSLRRSYSHGLGKLARPISQDNGAHYYERYCKQQKEVFDGFVLDDLAFIYLREYYHFIPLAAAYCLNHNNFFREADEWLRLLYNPLENQAGNSGRIIYKNLLGEGEAGYSFRNTSQWLHDPFNPYLIAQTRQGVFLRQAVFQYVENLLDWADAEFVRDTPESIVQARELYELAENILESEQLLIGVESVRTLKDIGATQPRSIKISLLGELQGNMVTARDSALEGLEDSVQDLAGSLSDWFDVATISPEVFLADLLPFKIGKGGFYAPANPVLETLRWRIEANLEKIRTGCNFAGVRRDLPIYSYPTDPVAAVQQAAAGESIEESIPGEPPPNYRFSYLIERARYYASIAQQLETILLQSYEKFDAESYTLLKAKQDLQVSGANLSLQDLRVTEANDGCTLATYQRERAEFQNTHFNELINTGLSEKEDCAMKNFWSAYNWGIAAGISESVYSSWQGVGSGMAMGTWWTAMVGGILGGVAGNTRANSNIYSMLSQGRAMQASFERREQEWEFQRDLAGKDILIGQQGETLATDRKNIVQQERNIAQLQQQFAAEVVNFLETKFTNKELWDWMARVVKRYYRAHLDIATQTARMAQKALVFERQEALTFIAPYYAETEKRDLLAAEQLLTDINRLDQHRLTTEKRRKELTKVISLASVAPVEFQQLRQQGWLTFATLMDWFDRDFPGHYMRLIKNVSLTVVGLIPPGESIHATLHNNGLSQIMVGPPWSQFKVIQRQPESIAVTAASNGTGLFELRLMTPCCCRSRAAAFRSSGPWKCRRARTGLIMIRWLTSTSPFAIRRWTIPAIVKRCSNRWALTSKDTCRSKIWHHSACAIPIPMNGTTCVIRLLKWNRPILHIR
jgi:hypothetical protein